MSVTKVTPDQHGWWKGYETHYYKVVFSVFGSGIRSWRGCTLGGGINIKRKYFPKWHVLIAKRYIRNISQISVTNLKSFLCTCICKANITSRGEMMFRTKNVQTESSRTKNLRPEFSRNAIFIIIYYQLTPFKPIVGIVEEHLYYINIWIYNVWAWLL